MSKVLLHVYQQSQIAPWITSDNPNGCLSDGSAESEHSDSDSDISWMSMSPITSDEEDDGSDTGLSSGDGRECTDDDDDDDDDDAAAPSSASAPPNTTPTLPHESTGERQLGHGRYNITH